jgi:hypothetical protein
MAEYSKIYERLDAITEKIDRNHTDFSKSLDQIDEKISKLNFHVFEGNGKPSILTRLALLEAREKPEGESHSKLKIFGMVSGIILIGLASIADVVLKTGIAETIKELVIAII